MTKFAIAGCQAEWEPGDNLDDMRRITARTKALYPWVDMVMFGELATFGGDRERAQPLPGPAESVYQEIAAENNIWFVPGSLFEKDGDKIYNTTPVINPDGEVVGRYRKMFPFFPYEANVTPGDQFLVFDVPDIGRFGVSICYDIWFPETIRSLVWMGAEVIIHPTMTYTIDRDVELSIVRATAAQHQCFVFDINTCGGLGIGRSIIAGPDGDVIYQSGTSREIMPVIIDLDRVRHSREYGMQGLAQTVKSFRDCEAVFPPYVQDSTSKYVDSLGPLAMPSSVRSKN